MSNNVGVSLVNLMLRRLFGFTAGFFYPNYSCCGRCHRPWAVCSGHAINYSDSGGCFALCEKCWSELLPKERLPYYESVVKSWIHESPDGYKHGGMSWDELLKALRENVLAGK